MKTYVTDSIPGPLVQYINEYSKIYRKALLFAVNQRLAGFADKSKLNTAIQQKFGINKRMAGSVIADADGKVDAAKEARKLHVKEIEGKVKSAEKWVKTAEKQLKDSKKHYAAKGWASKKASTHLKLSCFLDTQKTSWQSRKFAIHHKKRKIGHYVRQIAALKEAPIRVTIAPIGEAFFVGSKGESFGNQTFQFNGSAVRVRVAECLTAKYGEYIECDAAPFPYGQDKIEAALSTRGTSENKITKQLSEIKFGKALTHKFYAKDLRWFWAITVDLPRAPRITSDRRFGCIGIDINPGSIGYAVADEDGNLVAKGRIAFDVSSKRRGTTLAIIADVCNSLIRLAECYNTPICMEELDFARKKRELGEKGRRYARMLSNFAYSKFAEQLQMQCGNRGIEVILKNPAYSSQLGLIRYSRMFGMASDESAALVMARRGMVSIDFADPTRRSKRMSERVPRPIKALLGMNPRSHSWAVLSKLNTVLAGMSRHDFFSVSNWESKVKLSIAEKHGLSAS